MLVFWGRATSNPLFMYLLIYFFFNTVAGLMGFKLQVEDSHLNERYVGCVRDPVLSAVMGPL